MRGWSAWAVPWLALTACGGSGSADTIDFGDTEGGSRPAEESSTGFETDAGETDDGGSSDGGDTDPGESEPTFIPLSVEREAVDGPCTTLGVGERVAAVGPNAETWIATDSEDGTDVRTFGVRGERDFGFSTPASMLAAVALDGDGGAFATNEGLFTVHGPRVDLLAWPNDPQSIVALCGDLSVDGDGRVLADDVFTRDLNQWWRWNAPAGVAGPAAVMGMQPGACADRSGAGYVLQGDELWSVRADFVESLPRFGPASAAVGHDAFGLASISGDVLLIGTPDTEPTAYVFEAGAPTALAAGDNALYVLVQGRIYAMRDGAFVELTYEDAALDADALHGAGAGGVLLGSNDEVCFRGPQDPIELRGLRPSAHRRTADLDITVVTTVAQVQATLDGNPVPLDLAEGGAKRFVTEGLDEGWHTFEVSHEGTRRSVDFAVEKLTPATWDADIVPLFEEHCSGAGCHGPDPVSEDRPDLSDYSTWVDLAETVRTRVVVSADMPPPGASDWGVDDTLIVLGWLDAGLPEGE